MAYKSIPRPYDPEYRIFERDMKLLDVASDGKTEEVVRLLDQGANIEATDQGGCTALVWASRRGHVESVQLLLERGAQVNHQKNDGQTPLMRASQGGHVGCVKLLLDMGAEVNHIDKNGKTPLMLASGGGHVECVQLLLDKGAQVNDQDMNQQTALIEASRWGYFGCMQLLLDRGAQVNHQNEGGQTALIKASHVVGHDAGCVQLLLDRGAQLNHQDKDGNTALHLAAKHDYSYNVQVLMSQPGIDINLKNNEGRTAMMDAGYGSRAVYNQVLKTCKDFLADSYGKVVLCGNSGAGKNMLTQAIIKLSQPMTTTTRLGKHIFGWQDVVESSTAGIIPHQVDSALSNMVIYDLVRHQQYFNSHPAYLEAISLHNPATFLLLQDIRKDSEAITREVYYWSAMIDGVCHKCPQKSSVIVVGTHADLLTPEQVTTKLSHLQSAAEAAIRHQTLVKVVAQNLTRIGSDGMDQLMNLLHETNKAVISMCPPIPTHCSLLLAFFNEKLPPDVDAISFSNLLEQLKADPDKVIQPDVPQLIPILKTMSEKGLIVFIASEDVLNSWIVLHKEIILKKVNGAFSADPFLKEYNHLVSNTGIVPRSVLEKAFPEYNIEMITQFMIHFELCQPVDLSQVDTNMAPEGSSNPDLGPLLFFPALVNVGRPSSANVPCGSFGWSMIVKSSHQFFTPCFLHVLLRRLPFEYALVTVQIVPHFLSPSHSRSRDLKWLSETGVTTIIEMNEVARTHHFHCNPGCDVWSRGVKWLSETGVTIIVEMDEMFQSLSMAMSSPDRTDPKYLELAHSVLAVLKKTCQEFCPHVEVIEIISCPPEASSDHSDGTKVELSLLKKALLQGNKSVVDVSCQKHVVMEEWLKIEPCLPYLVGVSTSVVPSSSPQLLSELVGQAVPQLEDTPTMSELSERLNIPVQVGAKYSTFGVSLLEETNGAIVEALVEEYRGNAEQINMAVLQQWLQGRGVKPVTWSTLVSVLQNIGM